MSERVTIDPELCIGSTECNRIAGEAFRLDEARGVSVVLPGAESTDDALLEEAAIACPTQAIAVHASDAGSPDGGTR